MNELNKSQYDTLESASAEGPYGLLGSDTAPNGPILSIDTLKALEELGDVLRGIHKRMISEGYELIDGVIRKKEAQQCI
jgi:hypothetical protein